MVIRIALNSQAIARVMCAKGSAQCQRVNSQYTLAIIRISLLQYLFVEHRPPARLRAVCMGWTYTGSILEGSSLCGSQVGPLPPSPPHQLPLLAPVATSMLPSFPMQLYPVHDRRNHLPQDSAPSLEILLWWLVDQHSWNQRPVQESERSPRQGGSCLLNTVPSLPWQTFFIP